MAKQTTAIAKTPPAAQASQWLTQRSDQLAKWCQATVDPEMLIRIGARLVAKQEQFQDPKTWPSLYLALITAAQLGLEPDGPRGDAYLIPYWDSKMKCNLVQLQPGYRGLMKLITRSGEIKSIRSHVVHEHDIFEMQLGSDKRVDHQPAWKDRGAPVAVYSIATYADGDEDYELASWDDVMKAKASAKGKSPAWENWPDQMARKFVIKRHSNQLPLDGVARQAVAIDNIDSDSASADAQNIIDADGVEVIEAAPEPPVAPTAAAKPASAWAAKLAARKAERAEQRPATSSRQAIGRAVDKLTEASKAVSTKEQDAKAREEHGDGPPPKPDPGDAFDQCELCGGEAPKGQELCEPCAEGVREAEVQK